MRVYHYPPKLCTLVFPPKSTKPRCRFNRSGRHLIGDGLGKPLPRRAPQVLPEFTHQRRGLLPRGVPQQRLVRVAVRAVESVHVNGGAGRFRVARGNDGIGMLPTRGVR